MLGAVPNLLKSHTVALAVAAGAAAAGIGGAVAVSAATSAAGTPPAKRSTTAATHKTHRRVCPPSKAIGSLVSETSVGGVGHGSIVIRQPDGRSLTLDLTAHTKVVKFEGHGVAPTAESVTAIPPNDVLVVTGRHLYGKKPLVGRILDLGS